jgi:general secretion pathway protein C
MKKRQFYKLLLVAVILCFGVTGMVNLSRAITDPETGATMKVESVPAKTVPMATHDLGLRLVGTVVATNPNESLAIIEDQTTKKQLLRHEGSQVGKAVIKKILRNRVIIDAEGEEVMLSILHGRSSVNSDIRTATNRAVNEPMAQQRNGNNSRVTDRNPTIQLSREEVESSLKNVDEVMGQMEVSPFTVYDRPAGIEVTNIPTEGILSELGLGNGRIITSINDEAVTNPEQISSFLQELKQGGDFTIAVRNRGVRRRTQIIQLEVK